MNRIKKTLAISIVIILFTLTSIFYSNHLVEKSTAEKVYDNLQELPHNKVGLLLGTGKVLSNGRINLYYKYRIDAAERLFKSGKIDFILVSGDNSSKDYDEPSTIKEDLIKRGLPAQKIYLDYAGFRTHDSIVRCKEIFGQNSITIISQKFHNQRAIYIAYQRGMQAVGYNAQDVNINYARKTRIREAFARVKMVLDLIFGKKPKFLGDKIEIK